MPWKKLYISTPATKYVSVWGARINPIAATPPPNPVRIYAFRRRNRLQNHMPTRQPVEHAIATPGPFKAVTHFSGVWKSAPIPEKRFVSAKHAVGDTKQISPTMHPGRLQTRYRSW